MGFFSSSKKIIVSDPAFGSLQYRPSKDPSRGFFTGKGFFPPTDGDADYLIWADPSGPSDRQRALYQSIQANFDHYAASMKPRIEEEFRNWRPDFEIKDFRKEFTLKCVTTERGEVEPLRWELAFTNIHDRNHSVAVDFYGDELQGILIDG